MNYTVSISTFLGRVLFICTLFPFLSPVPVQSDLQPLVIIVAFIFLTSLLFTGEVNRNGLILFLGAFLFFSFTLFYKGGGLLDAIGLPKFISLLSAIILFASYRYIDKVLSLRILRVVIMIYFVFSIFILLDSQQAYSIQSFFVRHINSTEIGYRGISTFATEPGLLASLLIAFLLILDWLEDYHSDRRILYRLMLIMMVLMTKSGTGFLLLILYLLFTYTKYFFNKLSFLALAVVLSSLVIGIYLFSEEILAGDFGRGLQLIYYLFTNPGVLLADSSFLYRLYALFVGVISVVYYPFGVGFTDVRTVSDIIVSNIPFLAVFYSESKFGFRMVSSLGYLISVYGFLFFLGILLIYKLSKTSFKNKVFSFVFMSFSLSFAFPMIWLLLNLNKRLRR